MAFPTSNPNAEAISFNLRSHFTPTQFQSPSSSLSSSFHPHYAKTMQYMPGNAQFLHPVHQHATVLETFQLEKTKRIA